MLQLWIHWVDLIKAPKGASHRYTINKEYTIPDLHMRKNEWCGWLNWNSTHSTAYKGGWASNRPHEHPKSKPRANANATAKTAER